MQYPDHGDYESPPPTSYFRRQGRPWSPDPQDPLPSLYRQTDRTYHPYDSPYSPEERHAYRPQQRRDASDPSVEALDLADYSRIAQARSSNFAPFRPEYPEYPPSPPPARPFSAASRDTPSLVSSPDTLSSQSNNAHTRTGPSHRPFSLPPSSYTSLHTPPRSNEEPYVVRSLDSVQERPFGSDPDGEVDIARFPAWSRHWYTTPKDRGKQSQTSLPSPPERAAFFDPAYGGAGKHDPYPGSTTGWGSSSRDRDLLPWSQRDLAESGVTLDEEVKEERMRMLEREFGPNAPGSTPAGLERVVGSVDGKGNLITEGPRKRLATRIVEILLALTVAASSIYAVLAIKPKTSPPPAGRASTYALYVLSVLSFLASLWLFVVRPLCCGRRKASAGLTGDGLGGLAILPVQSLPGGKPPKGRRGKKGRGQGPPVQVNLIVDPTALMPGGMREDDEVDDGEGSTALLSGVGGRRQPKRRSVFEGLAMERAWKAARKELKWTLVFDIASLVLWAVEFVWIVIGSKCPAGGFDGWCNAFNVSTAGSCLLVVIFGLSIFFDVKDLHKSSVSPRTRP